MLILTRRVGETLMIGDHITVTVAAVLGDDVRFAVTSPKGTDVRCDAARVGHHTRVGESLAIGADIAIEVLGVKGRQVRLGTTAPKHVAVHREEVYRRNQDRTPVAENRNA